MRQVVGTEGEEVSVLGDVVGVPCGRTGARVGDVVWVSRKTGAAARGLRLLRSLCERLRVPTDCRELAELVAREHTHVHQSSGFGPEARLRLLERCDAWRRPDRFAELLLACECDARGRAGLEDRGLGLVEDLELAGHDLDLAGGELGVLRPVGAGADLAADEALQQRLLGLSLAAHQ